MTKQLPAILGGMMMGAVLSGASARGTPAWLIYVAPDGNDGWSGRLETANAAGTDGPLASLAGARDTVRRQRAARPDTPVTVLFRGGVYPVMATVVFTARDSGTAAAPVRYAAYRGEEPVFQGGSRIQGWTRVGENRYTTRLPDVAAGKWCFRQLFAGSRRLTRARCPNVDPTDPLRKGFFHVSPKTGGFGCIVGCIHNRGDWMKYEANIPADGDYVVWLRYGANNRQTEWATADMAGRTVLIVDGREPVPLLDLPDTGGWRPSRWGRTATVRLNKGRRTLVWKNVMGGGIDIDAYALCDDPAWEPKGIELAQPAAGHHLVVVQAEKFTESHGKQLRVSAGGGNPTLFPYTAGTFRPEWADAPGAEVHIFQSGSCRAFKEILSIDSVDPSRCEVRVSGETHADLRAGDRYFVENVPAELDAPGEWYLDVAEGALSVISDTPLDDMVVVAPSVCSLVRFEGNGTGDEAVRHISFSGLTFRFTDMTLDDGCAGYGMGTKGVFHWVGASDCSIEECRFENCGRYALASVAGARNRFLRCMVADSAQGGVLIIDSDHCQVADCTMERLGAVYKHVAGVVLTGARASDNVVEHNEIRDSARYGITCKNAGFRNRIEANALYRASTETYDTGGIEVTQQNRTQRSDSLIRGNLVVDVIGYSCTFDVPSYLSWGIYLDSFAGGYTVESNITVRSSHGFMIQGGQGNAVRNNIFVGGDTMPFIFANFAGNSRENVFERNIVYWQNSKLGFGRMGRDLEKAMSADHNLFYRPDVPLAEQDGWKQWRAKGFGEHSVIADPHFRDVAQDDFTLLSDSPALALGFHPIDCSRVGPREP